MDANYLYPPRVFCPAISDLLVDLPLPHQAIGENVVYFLSLFGFCLPSFVGCRLVLNPAVYQARLCMFQGLLPVVLKLPIIVNHSNRSIY